MVQEGGRSEKCLKCLISLEIKTCTTMLDAHAYGIFWFGENIWMKTKEQNKSTICHKHRWSNCIRWHSKKHGKWQTQITRSIATSA